MHSSFNDFCLKLLQFHSRFNFSVSSKIWFHFFQASSLQTQLIEEEGARQRIERNVASTEQDIESVRSTLDAEIKELKEKLKEQTKKGYI